ncbi:MAG: hypothetical protein R3240_10480, partial [Gammaproteobacteria bacterium]|nr:hypothetical protein [Gammaproteobacteria bacterium]
ETVEALQQNKAYEPIWRFNPENNIQEVMPIPKDLLEHWLWCVCRVRGQVVTPVASNGSYTNQPVCKAKVHICEVDKFWRFIAKLPDPDILRFRDDILWWLKYKLPKIEKLPTPGPGPGPDPSPYTAKDHLRLLLGKALPLASETTTSGSKYHSNMLSNESAQTLAEVMRYRSEQNLGNYQLLSGQISGLPVLSNATAIGSALFPLNIPSGLNKLSPQPEPPDLPINLGISTEAEAAFNSSSPVIIRDAILAHEKLILPLLCYWPWWWRFECDEIRVVETDHQGRFDTKIYYQCGEDKPDLYFWVEYRVEGSWETVYKPPLPCYTYWNYACNTDITIRVTDPRVKPCGVVPDLPGCKVAIMSLGNHVSFSEVQPASAGANEGLTTDGRPFGGTVQPQVWFSRTALIAKGITHYRWSYRRLTDPDGVTANVGTWKHMDRRVVRHYSVIDPVTDDLSFPADTLGPDPAYAGKDLFNLQDIDPPSPGIDWTVRDAREDTASAHFVTTNLEGGDAFAAAGKYEIKLELFNPTVSTTTPVDLTSEDVDIVVSNQPAPFSTDTITTEDAPTENLDLNSSGNVTGFKMTIRVDNNHCNAEIYTVSGTGLSVDPNCGFIEYSAGANANISYWAYHPNNFATFTFQIHRGTGINVPEASAEGSVGAPSVTTYAGPTDDPFTRNPSSVFSKTVTVNTLLTSNAPTGSELCNRAAFAETL